MSTRTSCLGMQGYSTAIFLSAFLLFSVQLVLAKYLLPWFGGTPAVWTTCMFFFQSLLVAGYAYAHLITTRFNHRTQGICQLALLGASLALLIWLGFIWGLPLRPDATWRPHGSSHPLWHLVLILSVSSGLQYFVLSSSGPLLQSWLTQTHRSQSPYRLYAFSNLGSLLGLLSYPFAVEPWMSLRQQAWLWSGGYVLYAILTGFLAVNVAGRGRAMVTSHQSKTPKPGLYTHAIWLGLAMWACIVFLATTNRICQDIAVVPFLWVLPLSLYLLSLIICFDKPRWFSRTVFHPAFAAAVFLACLVLNGWADNNGRLLIGVYSLVLFVSCMVCHGELARAKPEKHHLTSFYLMIALGGAAGGLFVALIAPHLFKGFWEYQFGLWGSAAFLFVVLLRDRSSWIYSSQFGLPAIALSTALLPGITSLASEGRAQSWKFLPILGLLFGFWAVIHWGQKENDSRLRAVPLFCTAALVMLGAVLIFPVWSRSRDVAWSRRNFYGVLTVRTRDWNDPETRAYSLYNGRIIHGLQFRAEDRRNIPTTYYSMGSGIGKAFTRLRERLLNSGQLHIGVVGLGIGTLAAYERPGDYIRFYEINPGVIQIAKDTRFFTYLNDCRADLDVIAGDARISMEEEVMRHQSQGFDLLAIDAFSGDAIPLHLLTQQAFEIYLKEIKEPDGILAVHITNSYLDLAPPLRRVADHFGLSYALVHNDDYPNGYSDWVLLSQNRSFIDSFLLKDDVRNSGGKKDRMRLWTDDYSNLLVALRR